LPQAGNALTRLQAEELSDKGPRRSRRIAEKCATMERYTSVEKLEIALTLTSAIASIEMAIDEAKQPAG
jgi:hypothetical protein